MSTPPTPKPRTALRGALAVATTLAAAAGLLSFAPANASAATTTIWGSGAPVGVALDSDTNSVELGTSFTPTLSGQATGIRFYKVKGASGTHTGSLWTKAGKKLASVSFTKETSSGWQTAKLASPVKLTAGQSYVVSYHVPRGGRYGATGYYSGTLGSATLPVQAAGLFTYCNSASVPTSTWHTTQYWVDVAFAPSGSAAPSTSASPTAAPTSVKPTTAPPASAAPTAPATPPASATPTAPATPPASATPSAPASTSSAPVGASVFPTRTSVGLPAGWTPKQVVNGDMTISTAGAVVEDLQITDGTIYVKANNVTLRRINGLGSYVKTDPGSSCSSGLVIEDSTFVKNGTTTDGGTPVIGDGGFTVRRSVIDGLPEGIRAGGLDVGCGAVSVESSYLHIVSPDVCKDWHGDGLQGYYGSKVTVRQSTFVLDERNGCYGTAPFFYPSGQGNTSVDIDGLLVSGGGYAFRNGMPGPVKNLNVVDGAWGYAPVDVKCSVVTAWQAQTVKLAGDGTVTPVRSVACTGSGS